MDTERIKVLFVCIHNSARSQMAEAFLKEIAGDIFEVSSAGIEAGKLNPLAVTAVSNIGIDISVNKSKSVLEFFKAGLSFDYVITVCDEAGGERCPIFPGVCKRLHWAIPDPSAATGTYNERLRRTRQVRDEIEKRVIGFLEDLVARRDNPDIDEDRMQARHLSANRGR